MLFRCYCLALVDNYNTPAKHTYSPARVKAPILCPIGPNITWSLDFMHDTLSMGKSIRTLNIIDDFNREALSITVENCPPAVRVVRELEKLIEWRGKLECIQSDNGLEFLSEVLQEWYSPNEDFAGKWIPAGRDVLVLWRKTQTASDRNFE
ncbi:DDE-type integrase/transposase/recombinase [Sphingobacterium siyangense]|uniref:DDE-type integrase/transposase/recombinase n=1 Tax=Sphingobacterium siyangense TaxID=459529 RepID=UPI003DA6341C